MRFTSSRAFSARACAKPRLKRNWGQVFESLESRLVLSNFQLTQVMALSPTSVQVDYAVTGTMPTGAAFDVVVHRSSSAQSLADAVSVGALTVVGEDLGAGTHRLTVALETPLDIHPARPFVVAVASPRQEGSDDVASDNTGSFRIWVVGAVVHGFSTSGGFPDWVRPMTRSLRDQGYDAAVPFNWGLASALPVPYVTQATARALTRQVNTAARGLSGLQPHDMVDVHLIGQSRGGPVIAQAASMLDTSGVAQLRRGFLKLTMLDAHPSDWNANGPKHVSFSDGPIGRLGALIYRTYGVWNNDPGMTISANVDQVEVLYQRNLVTQVNQGNIYESIVNDWGTVPLTVRDPGQTSVTYYDVSTQAGSHFGVVTFYTKQVVPTLRGGGTIPAPALTSPPAPPTNDGPAAGTSGLGTNSHEFRVLTDAKLGKAQAATATFILEQTDRLNQALRDRQYRTASAVLNRLTSYVRAQRERTLGKEAANELLALYVQTRLVAMPPFANLTELFFGDLRSASGRR